MFLLVLSPNMDEKVSLDRLSGKNYATWKFKLKHLLVSKGVWGHVDGSEVEPASSASADDKRRYTKLANQAMSAIVLAVADELLYLITDCTTAKLAWEALKTHFERDTLTNRLFLKKQYFRTEMKEGHSLVQHLRSMKELTDKLAVINAP